MKINALPFNLSLLNINNIDRNPLIKPVKVFDTFEGSTKNFHPEGLFSQEIFGAIGTAKRRETFSYIDLKCDIIHPLIYRLLCSKTLYKDIMAGNAFAIFDEKLKDFVKCKPGEGNIGYNFFVSNIHKLVLQDNDSAKRSFVIKVFEKYKNIFLINKLAVLPAGLRDYEIDEAGQPKKNEVNAFYVSILAKTNLMDPNILKINPEALDRTRYMLQNSVLELYQYFESLLKGKDKFIQQKWGTRKLFHGTRNVITSLIFDTDELSSDTLVKFNQSVVGLYEFIKMYQPISMFQIRRLLSKVLMGPNEPAYLVNPKTLHKEPVSIESEDYDKWMSNEGLEKTLTYFGTKEVRHDPLLIKDHYMFLLYLPNDKYFKIIQDIDEIPEEWSKNFPKAIIRPLSFCELLYIAMYKKAPNLPGYLTRFPISSIGSTYPCYCYLKTTVLSEKRYEIADDWQTVARDEDDNKIYRAISFPRPDSNFMETVSPHTSRIERLGADYDGDTVSFNGVFTEEALKEVKDLMGKRMNYVGPDGKLLFHYGGSNPLHYVLSSITKNKR